jgi:hypothetical protein
VWVRERWRAFLTLYLLGKIQFRNSVVRGIKNKCFPLVEKLGYDWALERAHLWRNKIEHLEQSGKLRGRAVVDNENAEGKLIKSSRRNAT